MNKKLVHFALLAMLGVSTAISPITAYASVDSDIESTTNKLTAELQKEEQSAQASFSGIAETIKDNEVKVESLVAEMTATQTNWKN